MKRHMTDFERKGFLVERIGVDGLMEESFRVGVGKENVMIKSYIFVAHLKEAKVSLQGQVNKQTKKPTMTKQEAT